MEVPNLQYIWQVFKRKSNIIKKFNENKHFNTHTLEVIKFKEKNELFKLKKNWRV